MPKIASVKKLKFATTKRPPYNKVWKICPISKGCPMKITQHGFDLACKKNREHRRGAFDTFIYEYCPICQGQKPDEITICTLEELMGV